MPGYRGHLVVGALCAGGALYSLSHYGVYAPPPPVAAALAAVAMAASLLPDMDTASKARPYVYGVLFAADAVLLAMGRLVEAALLGLAAMLPAIGPHRGWTHAWWAALVVPLPMLGLRLVWSEIQAAGVLDDPDLVWAAYGAAVGGYASHLLADRVI